MVKGSAQSEQQLLKPVAARRALARKAALVAEQRC